MTLTDSLIEYPCEFPLKIVGLQQAGFAQAVLEVVSKHDPEFAAASMEMRASKNARYVRLTCTIRATSRAQRDAPPPRRAHPRGADPGDRRRNLAGAAPARLYARPGGQAGTPAAPH